jgi:hypothetical protein
VIRSVAKTVEAKEDKKGESGKETREKKLEVTKTCHFHAPRGEKGSADASDASVRES